MSKLPVGAMIRLDEAAEMEAFIDERGPYARNFLCTMKPREVTEFLQRRCIARAEAEMARKPTKPTKPTKVNHKARIDARNERRRCIRAGYE